MLTITNSINAYPSRDDKSNKSDIGKQAVTGGGAIAAATSAARAKSAKSGFDMFYSASKLTELTKTSTQISQKTSGIMRKVSQSMKWAKDAVLNWGSKFKNIKFIKPIIESPAFTKFAGILGTSFGIITFLSCCTDIGKFTADTFENVIDK